MKQTIFSTMSNVTRQRVIKYVRSALNAPYVETFDMSFGYLKGTQKEAWGRETIATFRKAGFIVTKTVPGYVTFKFA